MQFKGNAQHDAQEFLLWLLDRVHEDINTVNSRPPIKVMPVPAMQQPDNNAVVHSGCDSSLLNV